MPKACTSQFPPMNPQVQSPQKTKPSKANLIKVIFISKIEENCKKQSHWNYLAFYHRLMEILPPILRKLVPIRLADRNWAGVNKAKPSKANEPKGHCIKLIGGKCQEQSQHAYQAYCQQLAAILPQLSGKLVPKPGFSIAD